MSRSLVKVCVACGTVLATAVILTHAGPLDPPAGPVAPTLKTLSEVEPRIAISAANTPGDGDSVFKISQPGSYYLTGNIAGANGKMGIEVAATATIDLNGFTITGVTGSTHGIGVTSSSARLTVRNGRILSFGTHGISAASAAPSTFENLTIEGCAGNGFDLGDVARMSGCIARNNTLIGIRLGGSSTATECTVTGNGTGIEVNSNSSASNCTLSFNTTRGILLAGDNGRAVGNQVAVSSSTGVGVVCTATAATIVENTLLGTNQAGQVGLSITGTGNIVGGNSVRRFGDAYSIAAGNQLSLVIGQLPESLDWPCSATLAGPLSATTGASGITINSDGVTVDLGGFELLGTGTSTGVGITSTGSRRNVAVRNGSVRNWAGGGVGIASCVAPQVVDVLAASNGGHGIATFGGEIIDCTSSQNIGAGISAGDNAVVQRCTSTGNTSDNIIVGASSTVLDCTANGSVNGHGINASFIYNTVSRCVANSNKLSGIRASQRTRVEKCTVLGNQQHGVHATFVGTVEGCTIGNNAVCGVLVDAGGGMLIRDNTFTENGNSTTLGAGVRVSGSGGGDRIEGNSFVVNYRSLDVQVGLNLIVRNTSLAPGAGGHYVIAGGNSYGPIVNVGGVGDISTVANANHPQANLTY